MSEGGQKWPRWFLVVMLALLATLAYAAVFGGLPGAGR